MIMTRPQVGAVVDKDGFLYAVGGGWHGTQRNSVERANLSADDGSVGTWEVVGMLTTNRALAGATIAGGRLYVVGGHTGSFGTGTTKTTERVLILTDGNLDPFIPWENLNAPRNRASVVVENATLYAIGGAGDGTTELIRLGLTNPDFADDLAGWQTSFGGLGARTVNVISEDSPHPYVVEIKSTGVGGSGGLSSADQTLNIDVSRATSVILGADVKAISASVIALFSLRTKRS